MPVVDLEGQVDVLDARPLGDLRIDLLGLVDGVLFHELLHGLADREVDVVPRSLGVLVLVAVGVADDQLHVEAVDLHAKILDFGLAKVTSPTPSDTPSALEHGETATREGMLLGTPQYMSPEQARGRPIDATSDVFSFGIVLYEMVTGRRPFEGISVTEVIIAIDRDAPTRASDVNPLVPEALERVIERCLEKGGCSSRWSTSRGLRCARC